MPFMKQVELATTNDLNTVLIMISIKLPTEIEENIEKLKTFDSSSSISNFFFWGGGAGFFWLDLLEVFLDECLYQL